MFNQSISVEALTPVDAKSRQRTLTKPPTITKFFTPFKEKDKKLLAGDQTNKPLASKPLKRTLSGSSQSASKRASKPLKRTSSGSSQSASKRSRKQENIVQMFTSTSKSSQTIKKQKKMTCPVCRIDISGYDNKKMNLHIDTCAIE